MTETAGAVSEVVTRRLFAMPADRRASTVTRLYQHSFPLVS